ncbi:Integrase catalytic domain-containing protein [Mycena chlorophos]|uniref:Integrase catalytic domain-containing protein n=1 Tax=Mycena chlorophos TaxID=658473 RepID=A0A8H6TKW3_MYCCL|nr:Integrase catalytic domain-containing protein [Mycena chlorophos]
MSRPDAFPPLPETDPETDADWSEQITNAYEDVRSAFDRAATVLGQDGPDPLRLQYHSDHILRQTVPILEALADEIGQDAWLYTAANALGGLVYDLEKAMVIAKKRERSNLHFFIPVQNQPSGQRGRPRKIIDRDWLADAVSSHRNISLKTISKHLKIDPKTLRASLRSHGLDRRFSELTDEDLDTLTREFKQDKPSSGLRYLIGHLRRRGIKVQRERVRQSLRRVDGLGLAMRSRRTIARPPYVSPRPNAKWHMDGHHKLIQYGIVIHGFIDGYDRVCTGLHASPNNKSTTVLEVFLNAIRQHGIPSRVRGDRGGENVKVSVWMIKHHGPGRGSFSWGLSTHNTPIERFWVEVGSQVVRPWRAFLSRLEREHQLNADNPHHLWLLHELFIDQINADLKQFQAEWNAHPMGNRGEISPEDARFLGQTSLGLYADDVRRIHPDVLQRYRNLQGEALDDAIAQDQEPEIRHDGVEAPRAEDPFDSDEAQRIFHNASRQVASSQIIPSGYGVTPNEWENGVYSEIEGLKVGKRVVQIRLPREVWLPRAVQWAQALDVILHMEGAGI